MDFAEDPDHRLIREAVRERLRPVPRRVLARARPDHEFPWEFYDAMAEGGWIGIAIPEEYGGGGRGITEASIVLEEVAASGAAMNGCVGDAPVDLRHEPGGQARLPRSCKQRYLPAVAAGRAARRLRRHRARRRHRHHRHHAPAPSATATTTSCSGRKVWTTKALDCEKVLLLVRTTPLEECERRTDGMTLLLADLQRPEVDIRPIPKMGRNAVVSCEVRYDDLPVPVERPRRRGGRGLHATCSTASTPSAS